jgi:hypothetical protein
MASISVDGIAGFTCPNISIFFSSRISGSKIDLSTALIPSVILAILHPIKLDKTVEEINNNSRKCQGD